MGVYDVVKDFEERVAEYAGANYGVAVNSCTNALMLSMFFRRVFDSYSGSVTIPAETYVGVAYSVINAGLEINFSHEKWKGAYTIEPIDVIDSALRFKRNMYVNGSLYCVSFHDKKVLPVCDGGMILTNNIVEYEILRRMRYDGRKPGVSVFDDNFTLPGFHCHMKPDVAARGLMLMDAVKDYNRDLECEYPDLSKYEIFEGRNGW